MRQRRLLEGRQDMVNTSDMVLTSDESQEIRELGVLSPQNDHHSLNLEKTEY